MPERVLVTGGTGYFGSLLVQKLLNRGFECRIFDLNDADDRPPEVEFVQGDIRDLESIRSACSGVDVIQHNVAQVPLVKDRSLFESVNIQGTENVLRAAAAAGVSKVIYTSSSAVFGATKSIPITEATVPTPGEAYGRAKYEGEKLCARFAGEGLDVSIIRPRTILGHGRLGIFQILFEWVREGSNIPVLGKGDNLYQFVHADDLAEACILAGQRPGSETYNCGAEDFGSMRETLEALCSHASTGSRVTGLPMTPAVWGMKVTGFLGLSPLGAYHALAYGRSIYFDVSKVKRELGWQAKRSNEQMMIESYDWYLENRDTVIRGSGASRHRSSVNQGILSLIKRFL